MSLIYLNDILKIILSGSSWCSFFAKSNIPLSIAVSFSFSELCALIKLDCSFISTYFGVSRYSEDTNNDSLWNPIASGNPMYTNAQQSLKSFHNSWLAYPSMKGAFSKCVSTSTMCWSGFLFSKIMSIAIYILNTKFSSGMLALKLWDRVE